MDRDAYPEQDPTPEAVVDALVAQAAAFSHAVSQADLTRAPAVELHRLLALVGAADEAVDRVFVVVDAANRAS